MSKAITITYKPKNEFVDQCWLENKYEQCCCICAYRKELHNHPWYTNEQIEVGTGIYICVCPELSFVIPTAKHSIGCEHFRNK